MTKPDLGRYGVFGRGATPQIEALGYGAIWVGGSPPAELAWVEPLLGATRSPGAEIDEMAVSSRTN